MSDGARNDDGRTAAPTPRPLTDRVLAWLPGNRWFWIVLWALVAPARPVMLLVELSLTGRPQPADIGDVFLTQGVFAYVIVVALAGSSLLVHRMGSLLPELESLTRGAGAAWAFPGIGSLLGPAALTILVVAFATPSTLVDYGPLVALVDMPFLAIMTLPIATFVWSYLVILVGLDRLGRSRLELDLFPQDRTLGLGPVGSVAFTGFGLVVVAAVPALLATGRDVTTFALTVGVVVLTVLLFVLSMARLHGQMRFAKAHYIELTRALVAEAYDPVRADPRLTTLAAQASALGAAQALADRADKILEWPIDERMIAFTTVVTTGVVTSLVVRLVLLAAGI